MSLKGSTFTMNPIEEAAIDWAEENTFRHIDDQVRAFTAGAEWALKHGGAPIKERNTEIPQMGDKPISRYIQELVDYAKEQEKRIAKLCNDAAVSGSFVYKAGYNASNSFGLTWKEAAERELDNRIKLQAVLAEIRASAWKL